MAGLIQNAAAGSIAAQNPLLSKAEAEIQSQVRPQDQAIVQKIVLAGRKVLYGEKTNQLVVDQLQQKGDKGELVGRGVMLLLMKLYQESKQTMPWGPAVPAGVLLICDVLDFAEKSGLLKANSKVLASATESFLSALAIKLKLNPKQLQAMQQEMTAQAEREELPEAEMAEGEQSANEQMVEDEEER